MTDDISRRDFVKQTVVGTMAMASVSSGVMAMAAPQGNVVHQVVAALGDLFIPSAPNDPGYKDLEQYGITDHVLKNLRVAGTVVEEFNNASKQSFQGKTFLELDGKQREQYLETIIDGSKIADARLRTQLQTFYRASRTRILTVYYQNYPEHEVKRNDQGEPILKAGDTHQITNPNTTKVVTGWDVAGFKGPMEWEEEEQRRAMMKKMHVYWYEGDIIKKLT